MSRARRSFLVAAVEAPQTTVGLTLRQWHDLLVVARDQALIARLSLRLREAGLFEQAPAKARRHMRVTDISVESTHTAIRFEVYRLVRALEALAVPIVLLKGSAYVMADLPTARGRYIGDLDVMVPRAQIAAVEQTLLAAGWMGVRMDAYDEHYYREWAHEIPPMKHPTRDTTLDLHHTIVALTSRFRPDADALFAAARPIPGTRLFVLCPADMVLHSIVHLINDEVANPLRDLFDIDDLLRHFGAQPEFWDDLLARASLHGLERPLYHALRQAKRIIGTAVPPHVEDSLAPRGPGPLLRVAMDWLFDRHFAADPPEARRWGIGLADFALYLRAHYLRMPLPLLVRHLAYKSWRRLVERWEASPEDPARHDRVEA